MAGDRVAELARRDYAGDLTTAEEWAEVFAAFGPRLPDEETLKRQRGNPELGPHGMERFRLFDAVGELAKVRAPTLVCTGEVDPITSVECAREIVGALPDGVGRMEVLEGCGHFPWLDDPERMMRLVRTFVESVDPGSVG